MKIQNMAQAVLAGLPEGAEVILPKGSSLVLEHAIGGEIDLRSGVLWLTEPGRPGDVFLRDGQRWVLGSDERVVLTAWAPSRLRLGSGGPGGGGPGGGGPAGDRGDRGDRAGNAP